MAGIVNWGYRAIHYVEQGALFNIGNQESCFSDWKKVSSFAFWFLSVFPPLGLAALAGLAILYTCTSIEELFSGDDSKRMVAVIRLVAVICSLAISIFSLPYGLTFLAVYKLLAAFVDIYQTWEKLQDGRGKIQESFMNIMISFPASMILLHPQIVFEMQNLFVMFIFLPIVCACLGAIYSSNAGYIPDPFTGRIFDRRGIVDRIIASLNGIQNHLNDHRQLIHQNPGDGIEGQPNPPQLIEEA